MVVIIRDFTDPAADSDDLMGVPFCLLIIDCGECRRTVGIGRIEHSDDRPS